MLNLTFWIITQSSHAESDVLYANTLQAWDLTFLTTIHYGYAESEFFTTTHSSQAESDIFDHNTFQPC
jgi:hypothetical protein